MRCSTVPLGEPSFFLSRLSYLVWVFFVLQVSAIAAFVRSHLEDQNVTFYLCEYSGSFFSILIFVHQPCSQPTVFHLPTPQQGAPGDRKKRNPRSEVVCNFAFLALVTLDCFPSCRHHTTQKDPWQAKCNFVWGKWFWSFSLLVFTTSPGGGYPPA